MKKMKKTTVLLSAALAVCLCSCATPVVMNESSDGTVVFSVPDLSSADRVVIGGEIPEEAVTVTDEEETEFFRAFIESVSAESRRSSKGYYGCLCSFGFYDGDAQICLVSMISDSEFVFDDGEHCEEEGNFRYPYLYSIASPDKEEVRALISRMTGLMGVKDFVFPPDSIDLGDFDFSGVTSVKLMRRYPAAEEIYLREIGEGVELDGLLSLAALISGRWEKPASDIGNSGQRLFVFMEGEEQILYLAFREDGLAAVFRPQRQGEGALAGSWTYALTDESAEAAEKMKGLFS